MPPVSPERYRQIKSIVHAALELDAAGQAAFLEEACRDDPELKAEVRSLLDHDRESAGFLEKPAIEAAEAACRLKPGSRLGPYEIVEPIGAGGMERCTGRTIHASAATSPSNCFPPPSRTTRGAWRDSNARLAPPVR